MESGFTTSIKPYMSRQSAYHSHGKATAHSTATGHSADVMKEMDSRARVAEGRALRINCDDAFIIREGVKDLDHKESPHSSQKRA